MKTSMLRLLLVSVLVLAAPALLLADPPSVVGRLNLMAGNVSFRPGSLDNWAPAVTNYPLTVGDHLWVDQGGRAEVHVGSIALRMGSETELSFLNLDESTWQIALTQGSLNVRLRSIDDSDVFEIDTPNAIVALAAAGSYRVNVTDSGDTQVVVWSGHALVIEEDNGWRVSAGEMATLSGEGSVAYYSQAAPRADSWDLWCVSRDRKEDSLLSVSYVSREMIGIEDLDEAGSWIVVAGYGTVWTPTVVPTGWAPYRYGHWAWVAPWGWTWIDDAAWGFAPFHYGRWAYVGSRWIWIPGTIVARPVYAPALVVFIGGDPNDAIDGVGWIPLGPQEVYVPPYTVTPAYVQRVNVTNVSDAARISSVNVSQVSYVNRTAPHAVTMVPQQVFVQSQPVSSAVIGLSVAQSQRVQVIGMSATVAPQTESVFAQSAAPTTVVRQPPASVLGRSVIVQTTPAPAPAPFVPGQAPFSTGVAQQTMPVQQSPVQTQQTTPQRQSPVQTQQTTPQRQSPAQTQQTSPSQQSPAQTQQTSPSQQSPQGSGLTTVNPSTRSPGQTQAGSDDQASARNLITTLKTRTLPETEKDLANARKDKGIKLDFNALEKQLASARSSLDEASRELAAGKTDQAMRRAQAVQRQLADIERAIEEARNGSSASGPQTGPTSAGSGSSGPASSGPASSGPSSTGPATTGQRGGSTGVSSHP